MSPTSDINLLDQVLAPDNVNQAWKRVRANKGAPGIDGLTIDDFVTHFRTIGQGLVEEIRHGRYQPYPVKFGDGYVCVIGNNGAKYAPKFVI